LIDLGILRVRSQAKSPGWRNQRLLNHLTYVESEGWGRKLGRWFNGGLLSEALPEKGKLAFHSFRHTFSHTLKNAGADMAVLSELEGHAVEGESSVANRYRGGFTPQVQLRELSKLDYGLDFSRLRQTIALEWPE
jgi:integrase